MNRGENIKTFCSEPNHIAEGLLHSDFVFDPGRKDLKGGRWTLVWWRDDFYDWQDGHWVRVSDAEMKRVVTEHLQYLNASTYDQEQEVRISTYVVNNILLCLSSKVRIPEKRELNTWPDGREKLYHTISVNNGLLQIRHSGRESIELVPHTPDYFTLTKLPYDYDPDAQCPQWLGFLKDVMLNNKDYILLLQQWIGYLFRPYLKEQKFLLCVGDGANGKGVFFEVIEALVGEQNCSHVSLTQFNRPFAPYTMLGKVLNATNESSHIIEDEAENVLKTLVAGDRTEFERKYKDSIQAKPTAKIMIATNALPRFNDKTQGIWRRILLVPFDKVIPNEEQVKDLANRIKTELSGILNWGFEGLQRLNKEGSFTIPESIRELLEEYRRDADPARAFLLENYAYSQNGESISCSTVYEDYKVWCDENNCKPMNNRTFGRHVRRIFPKVKKVRPGSGSRRERKYEGLTSYENEICWDADEPEKGNLEENLPF
jgi:putative DNA primase/helicase